MRLLEAVNWDANVQQCASLFVTVSLLSGLLCCFLLLVRLERSVQQAGEWEKSALNSDRGCNPVGQWVLNVVPIVTHQRLSTRCTAHDTRDNTRIHTCMHRTDATYARACATALGLQRVCAHDTVPRLEHTQVYVLRLTHRKQHPPALVACCHLALSHTAATLSIGL